MFVRRFIAVAVACIVASAGSLRAQAKPMDGGCGAAARDAVCIARIHAISLEDKARDVFEKWELDFAKIGTITDTGRLVLTMHGAALVVPIVTFALCYAELSRLRDLSLTAAPVRCSWEEE